MLTREQILEIDHYCAEHKMSLEARMDEISIGTKMQPGLAAQREDLSFNLRQAAHSFLR